MSSSAKYRFADLTLDVRAERLYRNGEQVPLKNRAWQVLRVLVENAGETVKKERIFAEVWSSAVVEDNNLTVAVSQIRQAVGEDANHKFIETVPRKGYRFVAKVELLDDDAPACDDALLDSVPEPEVAFISEGFRVNGRELIDSFDKTLERDDAVNESENAPAVLNVPIEKTWQSQRNLYAVAALIVGIAVLGAVMLLNTGEKQTQREPLRSNVSVNDEANQIYLTARQHLGKRSTDDHDRAVKAFTAATLKDHTFADAHSGLAIAQIQHGLGLYANQGLSAWQKSFPAAGDSAKRALQLDPDCDEALTALGFVNYRYQHDWTSAENNFRRALEINPDNVLARRWYANLLHKTGRFDRGFAEQQRALTLAPNSAIILHEMAWGGYLAKRFDDAAECLENAERHEGADAAALYNASEIYEAGGDHQKAVAAWKQAMTLEGANRMWVANLEKSWQKNGYPGFVRAKTDWLENLVEKDYVYPTDLAKGYAALGEPDKALDWLKKAVDARVPDVLSIKYAAAFGNLKDDARFQEILRQMRFP